MKKTISILLCIIFFCLAACGCGSGEKSSKGEKVKIVTTIFPVYDWVKNIVGDNDNVDITMLIDSGVDLHSFQPSARDIMKISDCDMFVFVGGESDKWTADALKGARNSEMKKLNIMQILGSLKVEEEEKEGMQAEEEEEGEEEEEIEYDEHIWLSLKNAAFACEKITEALCGIDSENAETYIKNNKEYTEKIKELDSRYKDAVKNATNKTLVFADRFPFAYMFKDYGLDYYAAFKGCSAETEASFETVIFLASKVDELGLKNIMKIESSDGSIARTVRENTRSKDQEIVAMNSLQSITANELENGADYLNIMEDNLTALSKVLK